MTAIQSMSTANRATASQYSAAMRSMNQSLSVCKDGSHDLHSDVGRKPKADHDGGQEQDERHFAQLHIAGQDSTQPSDRTVNSLVGTL